MYENDPAFELAKRWVERDRENAKAAYDRGDEYEAVIHAQMARMMEVMIGKVERMVDKSR